MVYNFEVTGVQLNEFLINSMSDFKHYDSRYQFVVELMYLTGCRAGEAINFDRWVAPNVDNFIMQPQKNNNVRYFSINQLPTSFYDNYKVGNSYFQGMTYRQLNGCVETLIGDNAFSVNSKRLECHIFRHNYAKLRLDEGFNDTQIALLMGERNAESARQYINSRIFSYNEILL